MRAGWRSVLASERFEHGSRLSERGWVSIARVAISAAAMAVAGSMAPQWIAYAQAGEAFEVSPVTAVGQGGGTPAWVAPNLSISRTPQRIAFQSALVGNIMAFAYGFPLERIERRPQWLYDDRYDVAVTTAAATSLAEQKVMLQKLLEERFGLVVHRISNPSPVYFLIRGSMVNLTETQEGDAEDIPRFRCALPSTPLQAGGRGIPNRRVCVLGHASMGDLTAWLSSQLSLPVLDQTGITGMYDFEMPELIRGGAERIIPAVQQALGLYLEVHRGSAESLIIDHVEKPSQN